MGKEKIAFILHPSDWKIFHNQLSELKPNKVFKKETVMSVVHWLNSFKSKEFSDLTLDGKTYFDGILILVPFFPEKQNISDLEIYSKIEKSLEIAQKEGCTIAAMGGFTSIAIQGKEMQLSEKYHIKVTSGNTTTTAVIIESINTLTEQFSIDLGSSTVSIIGASGDIGRGCFYYFAEKSKKIWLTARGIRPLEEMVAEVGGIYDCEINTTTDNENAIRNSNIVIFVTSAHSTIFNLDNFSPKTIVCDASAPTNVSDNGQIRKDVFLYHGGIAGIPLEIDFGFKAGLASLSHFYGCQTEGLLMATNPNILPSVGRGNIKKSAINLILKEIKECEGLESVYTWHDKTYSNHDLIEYKNFWLNY